MDRRPRARAHRRPAEGSRPRRRRSARALRLQAPALGPGRHRAASRARWWASLRRASAADRQPVLDRRPRSIRTRTRTRTRTWAVVVAARPTSRPSAPRTKRIRSPERWRSTVRRTSRTSPALRRWAARLPSVRLQRSVRPRPSVRLRRMQARSILRRSRLPVIPTALRFLPPVLRDRRLAARTALLLRDKAAALLTEHLPIPTAHLPAATARLLSRAPARPAWADPHLRTTARR